MDTTPEVPLPTPSDAKASEWVTALCAAGLDYRLDHTATGWIIYLPAPSAAAALAEVDAYEAVNRDWPPAAAPDTLAPAPRPASWSPLWAGGLLIAFYVWLGPFTATKPLLRAAAMDAEGVRDGQWWRVVTALLVHADAGHLAGNVCCLLLLGHAACTAFGSGLAWALILAAGVAGNALEAYCFPGRHLSVGASTAGFGALGLLVAHRAMQHARRWHFAAPAWRQFGVPVVAGLFLLALLGAGPRSDLVAHALGMASGAILGAGLGAAGTPPLRTWIQHAMELACLAVVMLAWRTVLGNATR